MLGRCGPRGLVVRRGLDGFVLAGRPGDFLIARCWPRGLVCVRCWPRGLVCVRHCLGLVRARCRLGGFVLVRSCLVGFVLVLLFVMFVFLPAISLLEPFLVPAIKVYGRFLDRLSKVFAKKV